MECCHHRFARLFSTFYIQGAFRTGFLLKLYFLRIIWEVADLQNVCFQQSSQDNIFHYVSNEMKISVFCFGGTLRIIQGTIPGQELNPNFLCTQHMIQFGGGVVVKDTSTNAKGLLLTVLRRPYRTLGMESESVNVFCKGKCPICCIVQTQSQSFGLKLYPWSL